MLNRFVKRAAVNNQFVKTATRSFGLWDGVTGAPADPILGLNTAY